MTTYTTCKEKAAWVILVDGVKKSVGYATEADALAAARKLGEPGDRFTKICSECGDWRLHRHSAFGYRADY